MKTVFLPFPADHQLAEEIAARTGADIGLVEWHHFPDGESLVTIDEGLHGRKVVIVASLRDPDRLAIPLRMAADTAREFGATSVGLVAPYLAYMRQDHRFQGGQAISASLFAGFLSESFDWLVTVDPHLHRISRLEDVFRIPTKRVAAAPVLADWILKNVPDSIILGPDSESQQWVADVAHIAARPYEVLRKVRSGDLSVEVSVPESAEFRNGTPVILDDIASSAHTMIRAVERLIVAGTRAPVCLVIHPVFAGDAYEQLRVAGASKVVSTNSIAHRSNGISLGHLLADPIEELTAITEHQPSN